MSLPPIVMPDTWQLDRHHSACMQCKKKFTWARRRHHCRRCGGVFCDRCTGARVELDAPHAGLHLGEAVRVCWRCASPAMLLPPSLWHYITCFLKHIDGNSLLQTCSRLQSVPLPYPIIKDLSERFHYRDPESAVHVSLGRVVIRATDKATRRPRALKLIAKRQFLSRRLWQRLQCELDLAHSVSHRAFPYLFDVLQTDTHVVLVLEDVSEGFLPLPEWCKQFDTTTPGPQSQYKYASLSPPVDPERACLEVFRELLDAVSYLHTVREVVHRQLIPSRILVHPRTLQVKVLGLRHAFPVNPPTNRFESALLSFSRLNMPQSLARKGIDTALSSLKGESFDAVAAAATFSTSPPTGSGLGSSRPIVGEIREPELGESPLAVQAPLLPLSFGSNSSLTSPAAAASPAQLLRPVPTPPMFANRTRPLQRPPKITIANSNFDLALERKAKLYSKQVDRRHDSIADSVRVQSMSFSQGNLFATRQGGTTSGVTSLSSSHRNGAVARVSAAENVEVVIAADTADQAAMPEVVAPELALLNVAKTHVDQPAVAARDVCKLDCFAAGLLLLQMLSHACGEPVDSARIARGTQAAAVGLHTVHESFSSSVCSGASAASPAVNSSFGAAARQVRPNAASAYLPAALQGKMQELRPETLSLLDGLLAVDPSLRLPAATAMRLPAMVDVGAAVAEADTVPVVGRREGSQVRMSLAAPPS